MTDKEAIETALSAVDSLSRNHVLVRRNGRFFMALPVNREAASRTLRLYQPQRTMALLAMFGVKILAATGLHHLVFPKFQGPGSQVALEPGLEGCKPGTTGLLLGSPEHRVRRAILSYQTENSWEVAKLAFGKDGRRVIEGEYAVLKSMPAGTTGIPQILGVHHGIDFSILRLPFLAGHVIPPRHGMRGLDLLESWILDLPSKPACDFPEWPAIRASLETSDSGRRALERLAGRQLRPVIRHGDFARWNLLGMKDGSCMAIDWEWGQPAGMPGIDAVHLFAQDARLVHQLPPVAVVRAVERALSEPRCRRYLEDCGWGEDSREVLLASIAFTVGTKQQSNEAVLEAALRNLM
jgi:hypothetical protein